MILFFSVGVWGSEQTQALSQEQSHSPNQDQDVHLEIPPEDEKIFGIEHDEVMAEINAQKKPQIPKDDEVVLTDQNTSLFLSSVVYATYGLGYALNSAEAPRHFEIGFGIPIIDQMKLGAFFRQVKADSVDQVYFETTGYTENRVYELKANTFGVWGLLEMTDRVSFSGAIGVSQTASSLKSVSTNAPLPSTLEIGSGGETSWKFAYRSGLRYEIPLNQFRFGAETGYSSSSDQANAAINEIYFSAVLRYDLGKR